MDRPPVIVTLPTALTMERLTIKTVASMTDGSCHVLATTPHPCHCHAADSVDNGALKSKKVTSTTGSSCQVLVTPLPPITVHAAQLEVQLSVVSSFQLPTAAGKHYEPGNPTKPVVGTSLGMYSNMCNRDTSVVVRSPIVGSRSR
jgi:hypothetical protein